MYKYQCSQCISMPNQFQLPGNINQKTTLDNSYYKQEFNLTQDQFFLPTTNNNENKAKFNGKICKEKLPLS